MTGHPYRELEHAKRGPLTRSEKLILGAKGLLKGEPLLEQHRHGLDSKNGLPLDERIRHARKVAGSDSIGNISAFIGVEDSPHVKKILISGFVLSFGKKYRELHDSLCNSESGMAAIASRTRRDGFMESSLDLAKVLFGKGAIDLDTLRKIVAGMEDAAEGVR